MFDKTSIDLRASFSKVQQAVMCVIEKLIIFTAERNAAVRFSQPPIIRTLRPERLVSTKTILLA